MERDTRPRSAWVGGVGKNSVTSATGGICVSVSDGLTLESELRVGRWLRGAGWVRKRERLGGQRCPAGGKVCWLVVWEWRTFCGRSVGGRAGKASWATGGVNVGVSIGESEWRTCLRSGGVRKGNVSAATGAMEGGSGQSTERPEGQDVP